MLTNEEATKHFETLASDVPLEERVESIRLLRENYDEVAALNSNLSESVEKATTREKELEEKLRQYANSYARGSQPTKEQQEQKQQEDEKPKVYGFAKLRGN